jgi:hypothetical protein
MTDLQAYGLVCLGIITAVVFPVLASAVRKYFPKGQSIAGLPDWFAKYLLLGVFGLVTGVAVFAIFKQAHPGPVTTWYGPYLAGFGWESTLDAFFRPRARGKSLIPDE